MAETARPRLLLVPLLTELEWTIRPALDEWAEVASYDQPGVGAAPAVEPLDYEALVERGLSEIERRGWASCIVVSDGLLDSIAVRLALARPERVTALALGHTRLSNDTEGKRPPVNGEVIAAFGQLLQRDYGGFVRHGLVQVTHGSIGDELAQQMLDRVPRRVALTIWELVNQPESIEARLRELDIPLLFAAHVGCLVTTREGFEDAVAAFPEARAVSVPDAPSVSAEFADALRAFCLERTESSA